MKSSERAARITIAELVCFLTLLTLFGSKYFRVARSNPSQNEDQQPLCTTATASLQFERAREFARKLHATCIVRIADISFMYDTSVIIFEFRLMTA
jgi:hypothetical protein